MLGKRNFVASSLLEFLGLAVGFLDAYGDVIASLAISSEKIRRLVDIAREQRGPEIASLATPQKLAGELSFAQLDVMGRF